MCFGRTPFRGFGCARWIWVQNGRPSQSPVLVCVSWCVFITKPGDAVKIIMSNSHESKSKNKDVAEKFFDDLEVVELQLEKVDSKLELKKRRRLSNN